MRVGDAFGESFLYYSAVNPSTRRLERKVTFVKRVVVYGLPILVGSGYYHPDEDGSVGWQGRPQEGFRACTHVVQHRWRKRERKSQEVAGHS